MSDTYPEGRVARDAPGIAARLDSIKIGLPVALFLTGLRSRVAAVKSFRTRRRIYRCNLQGLRIGALIPFPPIVGCCLGVTGTGREGDGGMSRVRLGGVLCTGVCDSEGYSSKVLSEIEYSSADFGIEM
jgi:hypothetical protein